MSLLRTPAALQASGSPGSVPSAERQEWLFEYKEDSTVATYKQIHGFTAAYAMQPYIQQIGGHRLRKSMAEVCCSSHKPSVETGGCTSRARYERTGRLCNSATAKEDEQHNILGALSQLDDLRSTHSHGSSNQAKP